MNASVSKARMTEGPVWKSIILFALPLFLGNLFQQLYNTADSLIVGNFLGSNPLAAVTSCGNLIFLLIGFFNGIAIGAGVVIARYFGAKNYEQMHRAIHTTVAFGLAVGVLLTALGTLLTPQILVWMGTPDNVLLDILFIAGCGMGVAGAALATIIAQFASAVICLVHLLRSQEVYRVSLREVRFEREMLSEIIRNGLPTGLQNSIIALGNVIVQSHINSFGDMAMAGCGAYSKVEGFAFLPITSFTMALTTFVGQNLGARQHERVRRGARFGILCSVALAELIGVLIFVFAPQLIRLFNGEPEVLRYGCDRTRCAALFYCLLAYSHCVGAILRGAGRATVPMTIMIVCWCVIRVIYLSITVPLFQSITPLYFGHPITWALSSILFFIYYRKADWLHTFD